MKQNKNLQPQDEQPLLVDSHAARIEQDRLDARGHINPAFDKSKAKSALTTLKTDLTGRTVVLRPDEVDHYEQLLADWVADLQPATPRERILTQSVADTHWRLQRLVHIESSLYALGRIRFEAQLANELFHDVEPALIPQLLDGYVHYVYEKQFRSLGVQEARLRREREKDLKELKQLQEKRLGNSQQQPEEKADEASVLQTLIAEVRAKGSSRPNQSEEAGFVFANGKTRGNTATSGQAEADQVSNEIARQAGKPSHLDREKA